MPPWQESLSHATLHQSATWPSVADHVVSAIDAAIVRPTTIQSQSKQLAWPYAFTNCNRPMRRPQGWYMVDKSNLSQICSSMLIPVSIFLTLNGKSFTLIFLFARFLYASVFAFLSTSYLVYLSLKLCHQNGFDRRSNNAGCSVQQGYSPF